MTAVFGTQWLFLLPGSLLHILRGFPEERIPSECLYSPPGFTLAPLLRPGLPLP